MHLFHSDKRLCRKSVYVPVHVDYIAILVSVLSALALKKMLARRISTLIIFVILDFIYHKFLSHKSQWCAPCRQGGATQTAKRKTPSQKGIPHAHVRHSTRITRQKAGTFHTRNPKPLSKTPNGLLGPVPSHPVPLRGVRIMARVAADATTAELERAGSATMIFLLPSHYYC